MRVPKVKWKGHITGIKENFIEALLSEIDPTNDDIGTQESLELETIEIDIKEISEEEKQHIELGRIFTLEIGLEDGEETRPYMDFQFSKLPEWTEEEKEKIQKRADDWLNNINWDESNDNNKI